jgi:hypothetical protein
MDFYVKLSIVIMPLTMFLQLSTISHIDMVAELGATLEPLNFCVVVRP